MLNLAGLLKLLVFQPIDKRDWKQVKKEDVKVGYSKFMNNRINDSQTEGLETFETKLMLFGKYPNLTELYRLLP
jgi:hypothetical protein